ncbi:YczE/YyaS/YitT family protein [Pontibacter pudoricolor]|uniref:YczE/YyaS/YitT family protein n=1 Tax=Pontibacter pudoricolor TaxID=2694930 RepID=UPI0013911607|nr:YitT family protein [Pontibacter pudoricolor]
MKNWIIRYSFFFAGLLLFGFANAMAVKVKYLGLHPWEVLNVALFQKFGFTIGTWSVLVGLVVIVIAWFVNRKYINIGTFLNTLLIGPFMDFFLWLDFLPEATHGWQDYALLFMAILIGSVAGGLYVSGGVGAGPRDGFMLSLSERTRLTVSQARIVVECIVLVIGFSLGGPIGIITFLYTFIQSPLFQITLRFFQKLRIFLTEEPAPEKVQVKQ